MFSRLAQIVVLSMFLGCVAATSSASTQVRVQSDDALSLLSPRCQTHLVVPEGINDYHTMVIGLRPEGASLFRVGISSTLFGSVGTHRVCYHYVEPGQREVVLYFVTQRPIRAFAVNPIEQTSTGRMTVHTAQLVYAVSCTIDDQRMDIQTVCSDAPSSLETGSACEYRPQIH